MQSKKFCTIFGDDIQLCYCDSFIPKWIQPNTTTSIIKTIVFVIKGTEFELLVWNNWTFWTSYICVRVRSLFSFNLLFSLSFSVSVYLPLTFLPLSLFIHLHNESDCCTLNVLMVLISGTATWCQCAHRDCCSRDKQDICPSDGADWQLSAEVG